MVLTFRHQSAKSGAILSPRPCSWVEVSTPTTRISLDGKGRKNSLKIIFEQGEDRFIFTENYLALLLEGNKELFSALKAVVLAYSETLSGEYGDREVVRNEEIQNAVKTISVYEKLITPDEK